MAIEFGKGITLAGGFDLGAKAPLDSRETVATLADRDAHVAGNRAYEGMLVYVEENKVTYQYVADAEGNLSWKEFGFNLNDFQTQVVDNLTTEDATKALSAKQGKVLDEKISAEAERATEAEQANAGAISALDTKVGEIPVDEEGNAVASTVISYVDKKVSDEETRAKAAEQVNADAIKAITDDYLVEADKTELQGNIDAVSGKVTTLIGEDTDKSVRMIANEELAKQLIAEGAKESLDTLAEIAAWIQSHPDDASAMNKAIEDLEALVGTLPEGVTATTVVGYVQEIVKAEEDRAKGVESELDERLQAIEAKFGDGEGNVASQISAAKEEAITESEEYADGLNTAMNTRVEALEAIDHDHANKEELDLIASGDKAKWDAAEAKAHEHANKALLDTYTQTEADLADAVTKKHAHENAEVLDGITSEKVTAWDAAEQSAKDFAEEKVNELANGTVATHTTEINSLDGRVDVLEAASATHAAQADLAAEVKAREEADSGLDSRLQAIEAKFGDGEGNVESQISAAKQEAIDAAATDATTKANTAEENAKKHADDLNTAMDERVDTLEAIDHTAYVAADTALEEKLNAAIALKADTSTLEQEVQDRKDADTAIEVKIGEVAEGKTVVQMISDAQTAATYDDTEVKADITALEEASATHAKQTDLEAEVTRATEKEAELLAAINAFVEISPEEISALFEPAEA